ESQAACLRDEHVRRRRRDEPVEEDERIVREIRDEAGERAGARHLVDVELPAVGAKTVAHAPVETVAAARPRRIVDALGNDEVDGAHSARSKVAEAMCDSWSVTARPSSVRPPSPSSPASARSASLSATTLASISVVVLTSASAGSSSRFR